MGKVYHKGPLLYSHLRDNTLDIACIRVADFDRTSFIASTVAPTLRAIEPQKAAPHLLNPGDLLLEKSGGGENQPVGAVVQYADTRKAVCSNFIARLGIAPGHLSRFLTYLHAALYALRVNSRYIKQSTGIQNLDSASYLLEIAGIPSVAEQDAIVTFLDSETSQVDALVAKNERLVELLQEKRIATITRAVASGLMPAGVMKDSGLGWLGEIPRHWPVAPLYARYEVALGKMLDAKRITGLSPGPYLRNVDVQWDSVNVENLPQMDFMPSERVRYGLSDGDLLVCEGGEVGRTAVWRSQLKQCYYQKAIHRLRPRSEQDFPRFQFYLMYACAKSGVFVSSGNPNTIDHLTAVKLSGYRFPFPPLDEQEQIATYLDRETAKIDALVAKVREAIGRLKELRIALISAAVTGKIDVREEAS